nr:hypothetical protein [Tanacetum cinerariifolium]
KISESEDWLLNSLMVLKRRESMNDLSGQEKGTSFVQDDACEILRSHTKWDEPDPVALTEGDVPRVGQEELFGEDARPHPPGPGKSTYPSKKANPIPRREPGEVTRQTHSRSICQLNFVSNGKPPKRRTRSL